MAVQAINITCPNCGAGLSMDQKNCNYCRSPVHITSINEVASLPTLQIHKYASSYRKDLAANPNDVTLNTSIAFCYLQLKMFDDAYNAFSKAIVDNFDNSETYFYLAVAMLKGKKAFLAPRADINKIEEYLQAAMMIEPKGIYYYFWAYIRYDHHFRKAYRMSPNYQELLAQAKQAGLSPTDITQLYSVLGVERPSVM